MAVVMATQQHFEAIWMFVGSSRAPRMCASLCVCVYVLKYSTAAMICRFTGPRINTERRCSDLSRDTHTLSQERTHILVFLLGWWLYSAGREAGSCMEECFNPQISRKTHWAGGLRRAEGNQQPKGHRFNPRHHYQWMRLKCSWASTYSLGL